MKNLTTEERNARFGEFLKNGREKKGLYQREVAALAGISKVYYCYIEQGKRNVDLDLAIRLCKVLGLDLRDYIEIYR